MISDTLRDAREYPSLDSGIFHGPRARRRKEAADKEAADKEVMDRDANYVAVGLCTAGHRHGGVVCVWYTDQQDRRTYQRYEIISGIGERAHRRQSGALLGVDVGKVARIMLDRCSTRPCR